MNDFRMEGTMFRYGSFMPRRYNYCKSLGVEPGKILLLRAFCSDENQGCPIILINKHFGIFPFNHGRGGGVVATERHGTYAEHGEDPVIIQASHVGHDAGDDSFGVYSRMHTGNCRHTACCGKLAAILAWYQEQYCFAQADVLLERYNGGLCLRIDNGLLRGMRNEDLFLELSRLVRRDAEGDFTPFTHTAPRRVSPPAS